MSSALIFRDPLLVPPLKGIVLPQHHLHPPATDENYYFIYKRVMTLK